MICKHFYEIYISLFLLISFLKVFLCKYTYNSIDCKVSCNNIACYSINCRQKVVKYVNHLGCKAKKSNNKNSEAKMFIASSLLKTFTFKAHKKLTRCTECFSTKIGFVTLGRLFTSSLYVKGSQELQSQLRLGKHPVKCCVHIKQTFLIND